jgi:drug/metabolite transporter (DMT)-like permease
VRGGGSRRFPTAIALLAFLSLGWGLAWPVTKIAVEQVPVWHLRAGTTLLAGLLMLTVAGLLGGRVAAPRSELARLAILAQFNVTGWCLFSAYGVSLMEAGRAGIIAFTMPIWTAILAVAIGQERMTPAKLLALGLGAAGLAALLAPEWREVAAAPFGVLAMTGSAIAWAIGTLGMKQVRWTTGPAVQSGWQLLFGALPMGIGILVMGERFDPASVDAEAWFAVAYLLVVGLLLSQWAWFGAVHALPATVAGIGSLSVPVIGVIGGAVWLGERVGAPEIAALVLIGASVLLAMRPQSAQEPAAPARAPASALGFDPKRLR